MNESLFLCLPAGRRMLRVVSMLGLALALTALGGCECGISDYQIPDDDDVGDDDTSPPLFGDEDCGNSLDDDGDGLADCFDPDCATDSACLHECSAAATLSCGEILSANNGGPGHSDAIDGYGCTTWDESGPEYAFEFTATITEEVTAVLTVAGHGNLDVFVLDGDEECDGTACLAYGASTVHWTANAGQDYLIVVDGYAGAQDSFSLELLCPSGGSGENCFNGIDDDGDGLADCNDPDCATDPNCVDENCNNNIDDDGDGYVDCDDTECWNESVCDGENCNNFVDDNGNGLIDCADPDCFIFPNCSTEQCYDAIDNDGDGLVDCDDPDCSGSSDCIPEWSCNNGFDDDGDFLVDCDDDECFGNTDCFGEQCLNNQDDDWDGLIDCDDPDCFTNPNCVAEICANGIDDDLDGDVDCDDVECAGVGNCSSLCTAAASISCGANLAGDTATDPGAADVISTYACTAANESGKEVAYSFAATTSGEATFVLDGLSSDLDLFGLQDLGTGCDPAGCLDFSTSGGNTAESVTITVNAGQTYYIVVEGWNNNEGPYTLAASCQASGTPEVCTNGIDDDGDSLVDCADFDCAGTVGCQIENCSDGLDNDGDGRVDCADPDCVPPPPLPSSPDCTPEICDNGLDDDGDGNTDCADSECSFLPVCGSENCVDGIDNDGDGRIDCIDPDCLGNPVCNPGAGGDDDTFGDDDDFFGGENCSNNIDDDGNGAVDCDDLICLFDILCWFLNEDCEDGNDNDLDGFVDCADPECYNPSFPGELPSAANAHPACVPEQCNNTVDDDSDGLTDCADPECATAPACLGEDCDNGIDDDFDGLIDCLDLECQVESVCIPENCSNGIDDDFDGALDCDDFECWGNPVCASSGEICDNDVDDNGNGLIDCAESACASHPICIPEICWNGTDDDGDGDHDCADSECADSVDCGDELCWNTVDDDGDGDIDCDDDECIGWPSCNSEICDNGVDDDSDGLVDCDDDGCVYFGDCIGETCNNDIDDDLDGLIDCGDPDCFGTAACTSSGEICSNGTDDDGDGQVDCADSDCVGLPACAEDCSNGSDDDGDGLADCADPDCTGAPGCIGELCDNNIDDDSDGAIDCGDSDCATNHVCIPEICGDGTDNDGDGLTDCDDEECAGVSAVCGEVCDNGVDDDGDGDIDLDDSDCASFPTPGFGLCSAEADLSCGDSESGYTFGSGSATVISAYSCNAWDQSGPEFAYVLRPEVSESVEICLSNTAEDLDIFILQDNGIGCHSSDCIEYGNNCATVEAIAGATYYVVVDGYEGAISTYDIDVSCPSTSEICDNGLDDDADGLTDCQDDGCADTVLCLELCQEAWVLSCGSVASGNTATYSSATDQVDSYSCVSWVESGPEYAYYFQAPLDQSNTVQVSLSYDATTDLDIFILSDEGIPCNSQECIEYGAVFAEFDTDPGADYWLAIDGYQGSSGAYTISISCAPVAGTEECDNGFDDDADGDVDCDDEDCQGSELCGAICQVAASISCGQQVRGTTSTSECEPPADPSDPPVDEDDDGLADCADPDCASYVGCGGTNPVGIENPLLYPFHPDTTDVMNFYPCNVGSFDGPEVVYEWTATVTGTVEWKLNASPLLPSQGVNHDPIVIDGDNTVCINTQCIIAGANSVQWEAVSGHRYYLVVDGADLFKGSYVGELDCDPLN
jgi:hypothetical protein